MKPFLPVLLCATVIFWLSVSSGIQLPKSVFSSDKLGHLAAYGLLNLLVIRALSKNNALSPKTATLAVLSATGYGVALEFVQLLFFPNRYFEVWDMVANFTGAVLGYFAFILFFTKS